MSAQFGPKDSASLSERIYVKAPVWESVMRLALPSVLCQVVMVLYSAADTYFVGRTGNANQVAAASLCLPALFFLAGLGSLLGVGGAGALSRAMGRKDIGLAKNCWALGFWLAVAGGAAVGGLFWLFGNGLPVFLGANGDTLGFCRKYLFWTGIAGAVPAVAGPVLSNLLRASGFAFEAGLGLAFGAVLNVILDPVFISGLGMGVEGAAVATLVSSCVGFLYFLWVAIRRGGETVSLGLLDCRLNGRLLGNLLGTGLPSALMCLMSTISNIVLNRIMASCCNEAVAGMGIAKRIDLLGFGMALGLSQGVLPLLGYCYGAGNFSRLKKALGVTMAAGIFGGAVFSLIFFFFARPLVGCFIADSVTVDYGIRFQRIMCVSFPGIAVTLVLVAFLQATERRAASLLLSCLRKGGLDVPGMLALNAMGGVFGVAWATPLADFGAMIISGLYLWKVRAELFK